MLKVNDKIVERNFVGEHFMMRIVSIKKDDVVEIGV